jgi:hypothetical protein
MSTKRSRVITVAAAGTLTLAAAISAAAVTLPGPAASSAASSVSANELSLAAMSHSAAAAQTVRPAVGSATQQVILFDQMRAEQGKQQRLAAAKAAAKAAKAKAAAKEAAHKAAERAAAAAAAQQSAAAAEPTQQAQPVQQDTVTVPSGSAQQVAQQMLSQYGWSSSQFSCLQPLWAQESGWNVTAENPSSGAYGIPQALPGSKMASAGADWATDAATQIRWGLTYIKDLYGSPCGAWSHEEADGWY